MAQVYTYNLLTFLQLDPSSAEQQKISCARTLFNISLILKINGIFY